MSSDDFTRDPLGIGPRLKELDRQLKAADQEAMRNIRAGLAQAISERNAAEKEVARLREALREIADYDLGPHTQTQPSAVSLKQRAARALRER
jgi:hypothetical protein